MTANPTTIPDGRRAIASQALSIITAHHYPMIHTEITTDTPRLLNPQDHAETVKTYATLSISEINQFHRRATGAAEAARRHSEEACHYALLAGTRLEQLRDSTPHGQWEGMFSNRNLTSNVAHNGECAGFDFSVDTARRYMEAAKRIRMEQSMSGIAQKKLIAIADAPELDETSRAFLDKLTAGRTLRQLYLDLEIITAPAPKEKPEKPAPPHIGKTEKQDRLEDAREMLQVWQDAWEKFVRQGYLDDLIPADLQRLKDFHLGMGDRIKSRLK
jgi:hypothetical protein